MKKILAAVALSALAFAAQAQQFTVATGDSKTGSTYSKMFQEFANFCSRDVQLQEVETTGSVKNVELLVGNQVNAALVQSDLLAFRRLTDEASVANIRTIFALHPEELHFIARADVKKEGGIMGFGGTKVSFDTVDDLMGRPVGAVGGSVLSARVVSAKSGLNLQVVELPNNDALLDALLSGKLDSILVVGGAPMKMVQGLDGRFKLLSLSPDLQKRLSDVYAPAKVSYGNLNQAGVNTISTEALLVTRTYRSPAMLTNISKLRECFSTNLANIQDFPKTHPKWQVVDSANHGKWTWYDIK